MNNLPTLQEFRIMRDQFALEGYYRRFPILKAQRLILQQQIKTIDALLNTCVLTDSGKNNYRGEKLALEWKHQSVCAEIWAIEADAPIRKARLEEDPNALLKARVTDMFQSVFNKTPVFVED